MTSKHRIDTLVEDIYNLFDPETKLKLNNPKYIQHVCKGIGEAVTTTLVERLTQDEYSTKGRLRLSAIGKDDYQLWHDFHGSPKEKLENSTLLKFLFGAIYEDVLLGLVTLAGHKVERQQDTVSLGGVKGHIDCYIDGVLVDVKSASPYSFNKFQSGTYLEEGAFAGEYKYQIASYYQAEPKQAEDFAAFLAIDKSSCKLALMKAPAKDMPDALQRVEDMKAIVAQPEPPEYPHLPEAMGKGGNLKLSTKASYCPYKNLYWPDLRVFFYSYGPVFLTHVEKEPDVPELARETEQDGNSKKET